MKKGVIVKGIGGFYDVLIDGDIHRCKARGIFRKDNIIPMVGDRVKINPIDLTIEEILPRKNQLFRPAVANVDILGIVVAAIHPLPDVFLVDKLMVSAEANEIEIFLIINKLDLADNEQSQQIIQEYEATGYPILKLSCKEGTGFTDLQNIMRNRVTTFAGQSGVGKSSIINALHPEHSLEIGDLSDRISRGRHTTRHVELLPLPIGGMVVDTPGFSVMNMSELLPENLQYYYPEFSSYLHQCKFQPCMHHSEPQCGVKEAIAEGRISSQRHERYIRLLQEVRENRRDIW